LLHFKRLRTNDLAREEIEIASRVNKELAAIQKARLTQAVQINKQMTASGEFGWIGTNMSSAQLRESKTALNDLKAYYAELSKTATQASVATNKLAASQRAGVSVHKETTDNILHLNEGLRGYITGVDNLLKIQARWYAARFVLFTAAELPMQAVKTGIEYSALINEWNGKLLRWGATSGEVTEGMRSQIKGLTEDLRTLVLKMPLTFEQAAKSTEGLCGCRCGHQYH
jgi:hypothetical protein